VGVGEAGELDFIFNSFPDKHFSLFRLSMALRAPPENQSLLQKRKRPNHPKIKALP